MTKKIISVILSVISVLMILVPSASALPVSAGSDELATQYMDGACPGSMDYAYFSPVKGNDDTTKYPLVIMLHGNKSGQNKRQQITAYEFVKWASDEYQAKFADTKGAFLLLPRSNNIDHSWYDYMTGNLMNVIKYFISQNADNIDTSRIYLMGLSAGGGMVYYMLTAYPTFFAAAVPIASLVQPMKNEMDTWKDTSIWIHCSDNDLYISANTSSSRPTFNYLAKIKTEKDTVRLSSYSKTVIADGTEVQANYNPQHHVWNGAFNDMHMTDGSSYAFTTTKNGAGQTITFDNPDSGLIDWLYRQHRPTDGNNSSNSTNKFLQILKSIISFFKRLLGLG